MPRSSPTPARARVRAPAGRPSGASSGEADASLEAARAIGRLFDRAHDVVLTTHVNPDGDGLGAQAGLAAYLTARGIRSRILNADPAPRRFGFLATDAVPLGVYRGYEEDGLAATDLLVILDTSVTARLGAVAEALPRVPARVCIDHHELREPLGEARLVDPTASSTSELVLRLLQALGATLTPEIAVALYVGIAFDTGFFRYANTTPETHLAAAELCRHGVNSEDVYSRMFATQTAARMRLWGIVLSTLTLDVGGRVAWMAVDRARMIETGAGVEDLDGLVEQGRQVEGVEISILFREEAPHLVKVSFRANGPADVNALAGRFGGGGHVKAAGATVAAPLAEVIPLVLGEARRALEGADAIAEAGLPAAEERRQLERHGSNEAP
ncbi:MAG TPA: bifunctional oligoribonuclease/PAP phosphatase NrnA [Gemmatimonadota bacterium]